MSSPCKERFKSLLPFRTLCSDDFSDGAYCLPRDQASKKRYVKTNTENLVRIMWFDVDKEDAWEAPEKVGLPTPSITVINPSTSHAHVGYELDAPVSLSCDSHVEPREFMFDVQRGIVKRLGADPNYSHTFSQNPLHDSFLTDWQGAASTYTLSRLNDYLDPKDKKRPKKKEVVLGLGRNCDLFYHLREIAYRQVLRFKKSGQQPEEFRIFLEGAALVLNQNFHTPLMVIEVRSIAQSVARWTWNRFTPSKFSAIQSYRGKKAWSKTDTLSKSQPWIEEGVSRRTWFRRKKGSIS